MVSGASYSYLDVSRNMADFVVGEEPHGQKEIPAQVLRTTSEVLWDWCSALKGDSGC